MILADKASQLAPEAPDESAGPRCPAAPPALLPALLNFGRVRLNVPCFKRVTCNHRIFIDKKYKSPILDQRVGSKSGAILSEPLFF